MFTFKKNYNDILKNRLAELSESFISCGYPSSMVYRISNKILTVQRDLNVLIKKKSPEKVVTPAHNVRIISTYGTDDLLVNCVKDTIPYLQDTNSFKSKTVKFNFTKKTAPSVGSKLSVLKKMSLDIGNSGTTKCEASNCQCCNVVPSSPKSKINVNGQKVFLPNGDCKSKNIIYLAECNLCTDNCYVG